GGWRYSEFGENLLSLIIEKILNFRQNHDMALMSWAKPMTSRPYRDFHIPYFNFAMLFALKSPP
ncbi:MAG: hypothetical protein KGS46_19740, partial [Chloroflexi bacterium]|nr:hypothetical protein [Chloroflexota bacterium]